MKMMIKNTCPLSGKWASPEVEGKSGAFRGRAVEGKREANIDATIIAGIEQVVGWALWFAAVRRINRATAPTWIVRDMLASTTLLAASTVCFLAALLLGASNLLWWIGILAGGLALAYIAWHALQNPGPVIGPLRADTERADMRGTLDGWTEVAPPRTRRPAGMGYASPSPTVRNIEAMEVAF
jgi:hypothetical protein